MTVATYCTSVSLNATEKLLQDEVRDDGPQRSEHNTDTQHVLIHTRQLDSSAIYSLLHFIILFFHVLL